MNIPTHIDIPVSRMEGDSGEVLLCRLEDLPANARVPGPARDDLFVRLADVQRTRHMLVVSASMRPCHDVDCVAAYVADDGTNINWDRDCIGHAAAIGVFAIRQGFIHRERLPREGTFAVRIWQQNVRKTIIVHVPVADNAVEGVRVELVDPVATPRQGTGSIFPTGNAVDRFDLPGFDTVSATLIDIGTPTMLVDIADSGASGAGGAGAELTRVLRAAGAARMGRASPIPRIVYVSAPRAFVAADGAHVAGCDVDLCAWGAVPDLLESAPDVVTIGIGAGIPGTVVNRKMESVARNTIRVGYPEGIVSVVASVRCMDGEWIVTRVLLRGSARALSENIVRLLNQAG